MAKSKEELLIHAVKMRERGETYRAVSIFLKNNTDDENDIGDIVRGISELEKNKKIEIPPKDVNESYALGSILGILFLLSGLVLLVLLWGKGVISTIPFILLGIGAWALTGKMN